VRVATAAPDGLHTHEDAEVLIDFGDAGVLSGRRDSPQSRPPSAAAPSRSQCGPTLGTFRKVPPLPGATHNSRNSLKETGTASGNTCLRQVGGPRLGATVAPTALREPRAHSSPVRTFGWGRARHSSARTLTTDRAPLSLPPRTSVESDPRLNRCWAQVHASRHTVAKLVGPGFVGSSSRAPLRRFPRTSSAATEMDLLVSCMGSGKQSVTTRRSLFHHHRLGRKRGPPLHPPRHHCRRGHWAPRSTCSPPRRPSRRHLFCLLHHRHSFSGYQPDHRALSLLSRRRAPGGHHHSDRSVWTRLRTPSWCC